MDLKKILGLVLILAVLGLGLIQYQYLRVGLNLARVQFENKVRNATAEMEADLRGQNELTYLVATSIGGSSGKFKVSSDSLEQAAVYFMQDYLGDVLEKNGLDMKFTFELGASDGRVLLRGKGLNEEESGQLFTQPVSLKGYLPETMGRPIWLNLKFTDVNYYFLKQLKGLLLPGILLLLLILGISIWALRALYFQGNVITVTNNFINNLTHELKTPVFSIGLAARILEEKATADQKPVLDMVRQQLGKLNTQIEKVLALASLEEQRKMAAMEKVPLLEFLKEQCEFFRSVGDLEGVHLECDLQLPHELCIRANRMQLEHVLNNLLDNARKYNSGQVSIKLEAALKGREAVIRIHDNGIGMSKEELKRIFDKYYRGGHPDLHEVKGYGLGLNYVSEVLKRHKARIEVQSQSGIGSIFTIKFPVIANGN